MKVTERKNYVFLYDERGGCKDADVLISIRFKYYRNMYLRYQRENKRFPSTLYIINYYG